MLYIHEIEDVTQLSREEVNGFDFKQLRRRFSGAYIANNQYTLNLAEETLAAGEAELFDWSPFYRQPRPDLSPRQRSAVGGSTQGLLVRWRLHRLLGLA